MTSAAVSKAELFERLAAGHAAGITVVTPNRRLAQVLRAEFDSFQVDRNKTVWEDADILPLDAFVQRCYEDALYAEGGGELPMLLSAPQQRELWEAAIAGSKWADALLDVPRTAARAMDAWRLAHAWRIAGAASAWTDKFDVTEDTRAFADWAKAYARRLKKDKLVDAATLPDLELKAPKTKMLVAYAFDIVPAQAGALFSRFSAQACHAARAQGNPAKSSFASPKDELETAARWARARMEAGAARVGVVIPQLEQRRREVARAFAREMGSAAPFNISIGEPLSGYPVVSFALGLIEFSCAEKPFEEVSRLIRSPFLGGAEAERSARALLDARLRREVPATVSLPRLIGILDEKDALRRLLEKIFNAKPASQSPHGWAQHFTALLEAAGFPGERALDSAEFQARARFNEVLGEFARLGLVSPVFSIQKAIRHLRRLCDEATFQPEAADAPVQVLGLLESAGLAFDALWVSGLADEAWPLRARPNPFLPLALQRKAGIPEAAAESSLALDVRLTEGWAQAAPEAVFSWPRRIDDRDLSPSPLIASLPEKVLALPSAPSFKELIFEKRKTESLEDAQAPPLVTKAVRGGTRVLADQAACPFRAFARHRLRAEALESPEPGPDAMDRGILLHRLMAAIWREAKTQEGIDPALIARCARLAVQGAGLDGRFAAIEEQRLVRLAGEWLALERERAPFEVVHVEHKRKLGIGGLEFAGQIDRMDRFLEGGLRGTHALIDYKTGARVTPKDWDGGRPDDPQLPLYALTAPEKVSAVAFAKLRAGEMKFAGFSAAGDAIPGLKAALDWEAMTRGWKSVLERLAGDFSAGGAAVDPKRGLQTCRRCDLHTLCRVHERVDALSAGEEDE
jgi:ATP-dependent helicase/nuclease subunit B